MKSLRYHINCLTENISPNELFHTLPEAYFRYHSNICSCGNKLTVLKTYPKTIATFEVGEFKAYITEMHCKKCEKIFLSEELCDLVPKGSKFGYDVLNFIGRSLFIESRDEKQIQDILKKHNIPISMRQIGYLGKKFIIYLALAHRESQEKIKKLMTSNGGYILHIDGTCEGSSPHLMVALDSLSEIVLDSVKLPSENSKQIIPFLENIKKIYGSPVAAVHDMGSGILRAIKEVFPKIFDFICHYHFLKDIGNDLFGAEYVIIRKTLAKNSTRPKLKKILKKLIKEIDTDKTLEKSRDLYIQQQLKGKICNDLPGEISSYLWIHWIFDYKKELYGYGFPFDRDHYVFYQRLVAVKRAIEILPHQIQVNYSINQLNRILNSILDDQDLKKTITLFKEKIT